MCDWIFPLYLSSFLVTSHMTMPLFNVLSLVLLSQQLKEIISLCTAGNLSQRVTVGHFPTPEELDKLFSTNARHASLSEVAEPSNNPKRNRATESSHDEPSNTPKRNRVTESSHGHDNGISAITYDHSHGGK